MEVILLEDIKNVGQAGDIKNVKSGYARNKLIPEGLALRASKKNIAVAEEKKTSIAKKMNRQDSIDSEKGEKINNTEITIETQVGDDDKMFGSVTSNDILKELNSKGHNLKKKQIELKDPIKSLGIFHIDVKVSSTITANIKLYVIKS